MNLFVTFLLFALGVALIVKGGDAFVDSASWIAEVSGIPKFVVGATIVSVATTLPELMVSTMASVEGKIDMALGNAVGSVTVNTGLILALSVLFMTISANRKEYLPKVCCLMASVLTIVIGSLTGTLQIWAVVVLVAIFAAFIYENVTSAKKTVSANTEKVEITKKTLTIQIVKFVLGAAGIVVGSRLLVNSGTDLATAFGVPERVIAVTMLAIGTSLPELVTTITSIVKKQTSLSVGNVIGANIIDLTLVLPACSIAAGKALPVSETAIRIDNPACLIICAVAMIPMLIKEKFAKWQGIALIALYAVYLILTV